MHGKFGQPQPQQQPRHARIAGHFAAHRHRLAGPLAGIDGVGHQPQHRRMQGIVERRHVVVAAVDGQRVLDQVVGADRQEIQRLREGLDRDGDGRHFDHGAHFHVRRVGLATRIQLAPRRLDGGPRRHHLVHVGDHRDQQPHRPMGRGPQDGAQLGREHLRARQAVTDGALPQRRIGGHRGFAVQRLVRADVERADGDGTARHHLHDGRVGLVLLFLARQVRTPHEQEFAAEQADAVRAGGQRQRRLFRQFDVGVQDDVDAVEGDGRLVAQQAEFGALIGVGGLAAAVFLQDAFRRIDHHRAGGAVDDQHVAVAHQLAHVAHGHHGRHAHAARHDGGMRGRPAQVGDKGGEASATQAQHVGRRDVVRHHHQRLVAAHVRHVRQDGRGAGQHVQHPLDHLAHVRAAFAQVFVFHGVELLAQDLALRGQRPFGVVVPLGDQRQRLLGQQRVAQQQAVHIEHRAQLARRIGRQGVGQLPQFLLGRGQRLGQAAALGRHVLGRDAVVRDFQRRRPHNHRAADGVTARHALAVQTNNGAG
ncbi:Uncharacterised protein [Achromobacter xylosoxidans]|nr:Uncharacterised protein [Achromobacter xylosoxidans]